MHTTDTISLLGVIAAYDKRTVGEADIEAWDEALEDMRFDECRAAVAEHFRSSTEFLLPVHVRRRVQDTRRDKYARQALAWNAADLIRKPAWFDEQVADSRLQFMADCTLDPAPDRIGLWLDPTGRPKTYGEQIA